MKQVRETKAGKSISAYIVLNELGHHVATVQSYYANSGGVQVDVWGRYEMIHQRKAGGYGYDKFTAALSGAVIEGHKIFDHCGTDEHTDKILKDYLSGKINQKTAERKAKAIGAGFANWVVEKKGWTSLHYSSGLKRLEAFGFKIFQAI